MTFKLKIIAIIAGCTTVLSLIAVVIMAYFMNVSTSYDVLHEVFANHDSFIGKQIEVTGYYSNSLLQDDYTLAEPVAGETVYHFVTAVDEYGCHELTVEFTTEDGVYPEIGDRIIVSGVFQEYSEESGTYYTIRAETYAKSVRQE